jgi:hypothetical protein
MWLVGCMLPLYGPIPEKEPKFGARTPVKEPRDGGFRLVKESILGGSLPEKESRDLVKPPLVRPDKPPVWANDGPE